MHLKVTLPGKMVYLELISSARDNVTLRSAMILLYSQNISGVPM